MHTDQLSPVSPPFSNYILCSTLLALIPSPERTGMMSRHHLCLLFVKLAKLWSTGPKERVSKAFAPCYQIQFIKIWLNFRYCL